jgi:hypothetical protein
MRDLAVCGLWLVGKVLRGDWVGGAFSGLRLSVGGTIGIGRWRCGAYLSELVALEVLDFWGPIVWSVGLFRIVFVGLCLPVAISGICSESFLRMGKWEL